MSDIYSLKLHETIKINNPRYDDCGNVRYCYKNTTIITRVPGGWIYGTMTVQGIDSVFVPFNDEFQLKETDSPRPPTDVPRPVGPL